MTWNWSFEPGCEDDGLAEEASLGWDTRARAESWLREVYPDLADAGVLAVTLTEDGAPAYTMSLADAV